MRPPLSFLFCLPLPLVSLLLTGCALTSTAPPSAIVGASVQGTVHGGQQAVIGARIYLLAASSGGYGHPSVSLLDPLVTLNPTDSVGSFVLSQNDGSFSITGTYTCTPDQDVYVYVRGGGPTISSPSNESIGLMAALGPCTDGTFLAAYPFITVNEVTTVAAAYGLSGFAADAAHIGSSGTAQAVTGLNNAMSTAVGLANVAAGQARSTTPSGGTVPQNEIDTLANILAACINSDGSISGPDDATPCYSLFTSARAGGSTGDAPGETATAAINMAHHPGSNVHTLYTLSTPSAPFATSFPEPSDFSLAISYPNGGANLAIDSAGAIWMTVDEAVIKLDNAGNLLSPPDGYTGGGMDASGFDSLSSIAIDPTGHVWVANAFAGISELSNAGAPLSPDTGITAGGIDFPFSIAVDGYGSVWIANYGGTVSKLSSTGDPLSPDDGYPVDGNSGFLGLAIDNNESVWLAGGSGLNKLSNCGMPSSSTTDCTPAPTSATTRCGFAISSSTPYTGGGINQPTAIAIDASGDAWVGNSSGNLTANVSEIGNTGCALSPPAGYDGATSTTSPSIDAMIFDGNGNLWTPTPTGIAELSPTGALQSPADGYISSTISNPSGIGIDSSGNVWVTNGTTTEFVGIAAPVATPLASAVQAGTLGKLP